MKEELCLALWDERRLERRQIMDDAKEVAAEEEEAEAWRQYDEACNARAARVAAWWHRNQ